MDEVQKLLKKVEDRKKNLSSLADEATALNNEINNLAGATSKLKHIVDNPKNIVIEIAREFESQTTLKGIDYRFLFLAIALQCARIYIIDQLTTVEKAGKDNNIEAYLHKKQAKIFEKFDADDAEIAREYYVPLSQIISLRGVPYDTTVYENENLGLFKGANHRFSTLGHDPLLGLIFGTTNILTSTITCYEEKTRVLGIKIPVTNHVVYDMNGKNPRIGQFGLTSQALMSAASRVDGDAKSVGAALIKQVIHIGTDMFTPCGINLPLADLVLSKKTVEEITKYVSAGDVVKIGSSALLAMGINFIIGAFHNMLYDNAYSESRIQRNVYNVKTRKIIMLSNVVATSSSVVKTAFETCNGNAMALKSMDWGGLIVTLYRLINDTEFINAVKHEFIVNEFIKKIDGD